MSARPALAQTGKAGPDPPRILMVVSFEPNLIATPTHTQRPDPRTTHQSPSSFRLHPSSFRRREPPGAAYAVAGTAFCSAAVRSVHQISTRFASGPTMKSA